MSLSLTDALCTTCGLCCDGTLFADVELAGTSEAVKLEVLGLNIEDPEGDHRGLLLQPCRALKGTRCSIYPHRPDCCRTFECRLLQETRRGVVAVDLAKKKIADTLHRIARIRALLGVLGHGDESLPIKERCAEVLSLSEELDGNSQTHRRRAELEIAMDSLERVLRETFLEG